MQKFMSTKYATEHHMSLRYIVGVNFEAHICKDSKFSKTLRLCAITTHLTSHTGVVHKVYLMNIKKVERLYQTTNELLNMNNLKRWLVKPYILEKRYCYM